MKDIVNIKYNWVTIKKLLDKLIRKEKVPENLTKSQSIDTVSKYLESIGLVKDEDFRVGFNVFSYDTYFALICKVNNKIKENYLKINDKLQNEYGWVHITTEMPDRMFRIIMGNKKKFLKDKSDVVYTLFYQPKLMLLSDENSGTFHYVVNKSKLNEILEFGIFPNIIKGNIIYSPENDNGNGVYLTNINDEIDIIRTIRGMLDDYESNEYILFEINTIDIEVYQGDDFGKSFYVLNNISPNNIRPIAKYIATEKYKIDKTDL